MTDTAVWQEGTERKQQRTVWGKHVASARSLGTASHHRAHDGARDTAVGKVSWAALMCDSHGVKPLFISWE